MEMSKDGAEVKAALTSKHNEKDRELNNYRRKFFRHSAFQKPLRSHQK